MLSHQFWTFELEANNVSTLKNNPWQRSAIVSKSAEEKNENDRLFILLLILGCFAISSNKVGFRLTSGIRVGECFPFTGR